MTKQFIGFTNKYYTLWSMTEDFKPLGNGHSYVVQHFTYIQNISMDRETAFKKFPGVEYMEGLRGKSHSFDYKKEVWDNVDTFRFGKYKYEKIESVNDLNYTAWYWDQVYAEHKDFVSEFLKKNGYEVRTHTWISYDGTEKTDEYLMSPEALEEEKKNIAAVNATIEKCKNNESFEFIPEYNLDEMGDYRDGDIIFHFAEIKENYYQGYTYYLPILNGKAKRFKNKNIKVTKYSYSVNNRIVTINVEDFEIMK